MPTDETRPDQNQPAPVDDRGATTDNTDQDSEPSLEAPEADRPDAHVAEK